jgi:hypothetical protein
MLGLINLAIIEHIPWVLLARIDWNNRGQLEQIKGLRPQLLSEFPAGNRT